MLEVEFRRPQLEDQELIYSYFHKYPSRSCDRTFANVFLWAKHYNVEFTKYKNVLIFRDDSAGYGFAFPAGEDEDVRAVIPELIQSARDAGQPFCMYGITKENFEKLNTWYPGMFEIEYDRDAAVSYTHLTLPTNSLV